MKTVVKKLRSSDFLSSAIALALGLGLSVGTYSAEYSFNIERQTLVSALEKLSIQTQLQFIYAVDSVSPFESTAFAGAMSAEQALQQLLQKTGLVYEYTSENTILIRPDVTKVHKEPVFLEEPQEAIEEVILIGAAVANRAGIAIKKQNQKIMDVLSGDDIGSLPELNVADTFRRLPGLNTIMAGSDDEGRYVTVRGISAGGELCDFRRHGHGDR